MCAKEYPNAKVIGSNDLTEPSSLGVSETKATIFSGRLETKRSHLPQMSNNLWRNSLFFVISGGIIYFLEGEREGGREGGGVGERREGGRRGGGTEGGRVKNKRACTCKSCINGRMKMWYV